MKDQVVGIAARTAFIGDKIAQILSDTLQDYPGSSQGALLHDDPLTIIIKSYCGCMGASSYYKANLLALKRLLTECELKTTVSDEDIRAISPETLENTLTEETIERDLIIYAETYSDPYKRFSECISSIREDLNRLKELNMMEKAKEVARQYAIESSKTDTTVSSPKTLIDKLRQEYHDAMHSIDLQSGEEINSGQEMRGIFTFTTALNKLSEIHEQLSTFYRALFSFSELLKRNNSQRLKQLGQEMLPTLELLKTVDAEEAKEKYVLDQFHKIGLRKQHWYLKESFLLEIEYMIDTLAILIEPEFIPVANADNSPGKEESDRYISSEVKLNVWRRDQGKCVECGGKERLEYDHIIPVSKGGSNTERNVQLLCETCNRKKAAAIQ